MALKDDLIYTRYADDITVSGLSTEAVLRFESLASKTIRSLKSPKLSFNVEKRGLYTKGQRRMVTGLIITPDGQVSVGRERKRLISAMLNRSSHNLLNPLERSRLKGLLGFCVATEPHFLRRMRIKYSDEVVDAAMRFYAPLRGDVAGLIP
jgi:hypothetical protein